MDGGRSARKKVGEIEGVFKADMHSIGPQDVQWLINRIHQLELGLEFYANAAHYHWSTGRSRPMEHILVEIDRGDFARSLIGKGGK